MASVRSSAAALTLLTHTVTDVVPPMGWRERYMRRFYPRHAGWMDGTVEFHAMCAEMFRPGPAVRILEVGAGPANETSAFLTRLGELHGADPDPEVLANPDLTSARVMVDGALGFPDAFFDCCVSNYVVEHVVDPEAHLREVYRVLKPGGVYVFRTPNRRHYVGLVAAHTPHAFHELVANRLRHLPPGSHAPYRAYYAMNTPRAVRQLSSRAGFRVESLRMVEKEPSYGMMARPLFLLFAAYERLVNSTERLRGLRAMIYVALRKPA